MANRTVERILHSSRGKFALWLGLFGGAVNVLVDIDHSPVLWGGKASRAFHPAILIGAGVIALCCLACIGGLLVRMVLKNKQKEGKQ